MAARRLIPLVLVSALAAAVGCADSGSGGSQTSKTAASGTTPDAGTAAKPTPSTASKRPLAKRPSADFHLDEGTSGRRRPRSEPSGSGRTLRLTLRSTPTGATAAVDGRVIGTTPTYWEGVANGKPREFTFVHAGYAMARYRFVAVSDGVVHGTLTKVVVEEPDAGPKTPAPKN